MFLDYQVLVRLPRDGARGVPGDWDGDVLKVQSRNPMGHARLTYDLSGADALKVSMETSEDGETWRPMFRGAYTRQS